LVLIIPYLKKTYGHFQELKIEKSFFKDPHFFDLLAGGSELRQALEKGLTEEEFNKLIKAQIDLFLSKRAKHLRYK